MCCDSKLFGRALPNRRAAVLAPATSIRHVTIMIHSTAQTNMHLNEVPDTDYTDSKSKVACQS